MNKEKQNKNNEFASLILLFVLCLTTGFCITLFLKKSVLDFDFYDKFAGLR